MNWVLVYHNETQNTFLLTNATPEANTAAAAAATYDQGGAMLYIIVVVLIYGFSIVLMIASSLRKNSQDAFVGKHMKEMEGIRRMERRRSTLPLLYRLPATTPTSPQPGSSDQKSTRSLPDMDESDVAGGPFGRRTDERVLPFSSIRRASTGQTTLPSVIVDLEHSPSIERRSLLSSRATSNNGTVTLLCPSPVALPDPPSRPSKRDVKLEMTAIAGDVPPKPLETVLEMSEL